MLYISSPPTNEEANFLCVIIWSTIENQFWWFNNLIFCVCVCVIFGILDFFLFCFHSSSISPLCVMRCDYGIHHGKLCYSGLQLKYTKKNLVTAHIIRDKLCVCAEELETKMPFSFSFFFFAFWIIIISWARKEALMMMMIKLMTKTFDYVVVVFCLLYDFIT